MAQLRYGSGGASNDPDRRIKGSEIFVGGLSRSTTESTIREIFSPYGEIVELRMMKDQNGTPKGFCFVRFSTKEAAFRALKEKDGTMLHGKKIGVNHSSDQDLLFFGNLRKDWSSEEFEKLVRQAFKDVVSVDLALPSSTRASHAEKKQLNRGFAFVQFSTHAAAARAHRIGSKPDFLLGSDWHPVIDWAEKEPEIDPEELAKIKTAFVGNLPTNADEEFLKILFQPLGKIEKVAISRKGRFPVGFVHFANRSDLNKAINELDGKTVQGPIRGPNFKIQVSVAKPVEKDRKRAHEEIKSKPLILPGARSIVSNVSESHDLLDRKSKAPKLANVVPDLADPYEKAVIALPSAVKERLLRVLRLGIATRYDVDIQCIASLQALPDSAATAVLDQFLLSGADKRDKGAYFASLVARQQIEKLGSRWNSSHLPLRPIDFTSKETELFNLRGPQHSQVIDSTASRYSTYNSSAGLHPYSSQLKDDPLLSRPNLGKFGEVTAFREPVSSTLGYGTTTRSGSFPNSSLPNSSTERPTGRPQMRFDPFTGQPYKFDPFTGEPIRQE